MNHNCHHISELMRKQNVSHPVYQKEFRTCVYSIKICVHIVIVFQKPTPKVWQSL